jgi:hypothetical protein
MFARSPRTFRLSVSLVPLACFALFAILLTPSPAAAQDKESHWGARVSFVPEWEIHESIRKVLFEEEENGQMKGSEFSIGFVRGSTLGGDWGVSFVRKPFDNESGTTENDQDCFNQAQTNCQPRTETMRFDNVYLNAFEVHWFVAFATFANRVQIGLNVAGGVGSMKGNVIRTTDRFQPTNFGPNGPTAFTAIHEVEVLPAKDELMPIFPLIKLEAEGAFIVAPGLKVKVAGGMNFPAVGLRVGAVYLIGAN